MPCSGGLRSRIDTYFMAPIAVLDSARGVEPSLANAAVVGGTCYLINANHENESTSGVAH